ncbi:MAG: DNA methylase N-4 [Desulfamplus sp.]|nr:DNA methylase N-4 [Desulfamplus sp.]
MEIFRQKENCCFGSVRVDSIEILERGCFELDRYGDASGELYFYDLSATQHPSYSVNGLLVHNCLRSYGSLTYQNFLTLFGSIRFKFVATATPAPNRFKEMIHYSGFLGVMDTGAALTRFFKRDSTQANNLQIHPHKTKEFWLWVSSWALFLQKPSDLGYDDTGYDLPALNTHYHQVDSDAVPSQDRDGQMMFFADASLSLKDAAKEKQGSMTYRVEKMIEIVRTLGDEQFIIWCDLDREQKAIEKTLKQLGISYVSLYGSTDIDSREVAINQWKDKEKTAFVSKPMMYGSGINMQQCHTEIFLGINYKANDFLQAIHRIHRFQQVHDCDIHIIYASTEIQILDVLKKKWLQHEEMVGKMTDIIKKYGLSHSEISRELERKMGVERIEVKGKRFLLAHNDCVKECEIMEDNSVDLIHTSIPFSNHYEYSPSYNDMGCTQNNDHFWEQMDYLTPNLLRVLKPGRIYACHTKDRINFGNVTGKGAPTVSPFHMETTFHSIKHGFDYMGMITVVTDVVRENNQTYRLGWSEQCKDATKMGVGSPEYILLFRKPQTDRTKGYADVPVKKSKDEYSRARWQVDAHGFWRSSGDRLLNPDDLAGLPMEQILDTFKKYSIEEIYDYDTHIKIGETLDLHGHLPSTFMSIAPESTHPEVWTDVNRMLTLNTSQAKRNLNLHICPLQFDIVDRIITRFSNPDDLVFDPFAGLGTVPLRALKLGRKGRGVELNPESFKDSVKYLQAEERNKKMPSLFDYMECAA